ncbi:MAG: CPBP family intramembrane glutamic endopeptidase [Pseudomonadota bacterium]
MPHHVPTALRAIGILAALAVTPFVPAWGGLTLAVGAIAATWVPPRPPPAVSLFGTVVALLLGLLAVPGLFATWPLPLLLALGAGALAARFVPALRPALTSWRRGRPTRRDVAPALAFLALPAVALVGWYALAHPDLTDIAARVPPWPLPLLVLVGLAFAAANALAEEALFRWLAWDALEAGFARAAPVLALQALAFGLLHFQGFPRGWSGVLLACVYGAMMGELRRRTGGLLLPWVVHVGADLVIFAVVASLA